MLITATVVRQDGTIGEIDEAVFGFSHVIGIGPAAIGFFKGNTNAVGADYTIQSTDFEVLGDATAGDFTLQLPPATGSGLFLHLEKIDDTEHVVTVAADGSDLIQGSGSIALIEQWADCWLIDASSGFWDNPGASGSGGAGSLADLSDVAIDTPTDTQVLTYDAGTDKWINADSQGGGGGSTWGTITGTLSSQTDLQTALDAKVPTSRTVNGHALSSNVTVSASDVGAPSGSGTSTGTNTGDQTTIVGITGTLAQFNTALTGTDFASGGGTVTGASSGTNTGDQTSIVGITGTLSEFNTALTGADFASGGGTVTGASSGTNTGDQTSIVGISGTLSEFNTALTGADFATGGGTVSGTSSGTNTGDQTTVSGNAGTATALATARNINSVSFNGTADITVTAAAGTLTGATLASGVTASSLTSFGASPTLTTPVLGTPTSGTMTNVTGTANGLTAGDVTRNHPVYAAASPPTVDVGPFVVVKTGIGVGTGLGGGAATTIFTVPSGRSFVHTGTHLVVTSVTGGANGAPQFKIQNDSGPTAMSGSTTGGTAIPVVGSMWNIINAAAIVMSVASATNNVQLVVLTANTSTTCVVSCFVEGYYVA